VRQLGCNIFSTDVILEKVVIVAGELRNASTTWSLVLGGVFEVEGLGVEQLEVRRSKAGEGQNQRGVHCEYESDWGVRAGKEAEGMVTTSNTETQVREGRNVLEKKKK
jgi:hypothetical protein